MAKGSPVYRREEQRAVWGIVTVRQRNILIVAFIVCLFLINAPRKTIEHPEFQWTVRAVPIIQEIGTTNISNSGFGTDSEADAAEMVVKQFPIYDVKDVEVSYTKKTAQLTWPEDQNNSSAYRYDIFLNGQKVGDSGYGFYIHQYVPDSPSEDSGTYRLPGIYVVKLIVFILFVLVAYVDYNGTYLERYALRMFSQYFEFKSLMKVPLLGFSIKLPVRKQTRFVIGTHSDVSVVARAVIRKAPKPKIYSLKSEPVIEKVFTDISQPIQFTSKLGAIEIVHPQISIVMMRDQKGEINVVIRDK